MAARSRSGAWSLSIRDASPRRLHRRKIVNFTNLAIDFRLTIPPAVGNVPPPEVGFPRLLYPARPSPRSPAQIGERGAAPRFHFLFLLRLSTQSRASQIASFFLFRNPLSPHRRRSRPKQGCPESPPRFDCG